MPTPSAAEVLALHTEWALNISVSTPALVTRFLSHLAIVEEHTGLWCLHTPRNREVYDRFGATFILLKSHHWAQQLIPGKKNSDLCFCCLDCFDREEGRKVTPSGEHDLRLRSRDARSADLDGLVSANSLWVSSWSGKFVFSPLDLTYFVTTPTSQIWV